jgi:hypothetical protein
VKSICLFILLLSTKLVQAHEPNLSNLMIYEQNGKYLLVIKSSLTAFEGEVDYHFKKGAYKSPEEFIKLVIKHFEDNCFVMINEKSIRLIKPKVILGHETTLFAELEIKPGEVNSLFLKNAFFKDVYNNQCEFIFSLKDLPKYQYILNNANKHEITLTTKNNKWIVMEPDNWANKTPNLLLGILVFLIIVAVIIIAIRKKNKKS